MRKGKSEKSGFFTTKVMVFIISALIILYLVSISIGYYKTEYVKKPAVEEKIKAGDLDFLYNFYVSATPFINDRPYYGYKKAPISMIVFLDLSSNESLYFINNVFPQIEEEFINTGKLRYYHKHHITIDDYNEKNINFIYAQALQCVYSLKKESYFDFYFELFKLQESQDISDLAVQYNLSEQEFNRCIEEQDFDEIEQDISEVENYGIVGISPRIYIGITGTDSTIIDGIPNYTKLRRVIRKYQVQLGD